MADTIFKYPLDLSGTSPDNRVIDEGHTIGTTRARIFAADYGPFYGNSVIVKDGDTGEELTALEDYVLVHYYREAAKASGQAVYAAVRIVNPDVSTNILFTAQMVGGEFSYSTYAIKQAIEDLLNDDRPVAWGDLIGVPAQFVPTPHLHSAYDLYGLKYLVEAQYDVAAAIREGDAASRQMLVDQMTQHRDGVDAFLTAVANAYGDAAAELAQL